MPIGVRVLSNRPDSEGARETMRVEGAGIEIAAKTIWPRIEMIWLAQGLLGEI